MGHVGNDKDGIKKHKRRVAEKRVAGSQRETIFIRKTRSHSAKNYTSPKKHRKEYRWK